MSPQSPSTATVGLIANPAAGKDIRRLVSAASPVSDMAKIGIVRRAAIGAFEGGAERLLLADDRHALARRATDGLGLPVEVLDLPLLSSGRDTQRAAAAFADARVGAVVVLGGDGTHRDVVKGWRRAPIVALSTGTNNVFPRAHEATVAGYAAGITASGQVALSQIARHAKVIDVDIHRADGTESRELGLVDLALISSSFTGSRAVWDAASVIQLVAAIAEPATVGLSAIAAALAPTDRHQPGGVAVLFPRGAGGRCRRPRSVRCPIAPGLYVDVAIADYRQVAAGEPVTLDGPGTLSFDGERDVVLRCGDRAVARIASDGPNVIAVDRALLVAVAGGGSS
ncbi:MAG: NAD(+)/NADH kinase [Acidimicrobiia bacterium]|nr:NAD(+)/NADH kinase [Acidimicrobiia bacterium]